MSQLSLSLTRSYVLPVLLPLLVLVGCTPQRTPEGDTTETEEYSGEAIFRGLVLGEGSVAKEISVIQEHFLVNNYVESEVQRQALVNFNQDLIDQISESEPEYFARFRERIASGDRSEILNTLNEASTVAIEGAMQMESVQSFQKRLQEDPALADSILPSLERHDARARTVEETERILKAFAAGELGPDSEPSIPQVGQGWLVRPHMHSGMAVGVVLEAAVAVCAVYKVTFWTDDNGNSGDQIPYPQYDDERLNLLQERAIDEIARKFG